MMVKGGCQWESGLGNVEVKTGYVTVNGGYAVGVHGILEEDDSSWGEDKMGDVHHNVAHIDVAHTNLVRIDLDQLNNCKANGGHDGTGSGTLCIAGEGVVNRDESSWVESPG